MVPSDGARLQCLKLPIYTLKQESHGRLGFIRQSPVGFRVIVALKLPEHRFGARLASAHDFVLNLAQPPKRWVASK